MGHYCCRARNISAEAIVGCGRWAPTDRAIVADVGEFIGEDAVADAAMCRALLEHVPDTPRAMRALARVLKDGGRLSFSCRLATPFSHASTCF